MKTMITSIIITGVILLISTGSFAGRMLMPSVAADSSLPKITFFSVRHDSNKNIIAWEATADLSTVYYEVQKSDDSAHFTTIAMVLGPKPMQNGRNVFEFNDKLFRQKSIAYYRIKQVNTAGVFFYTGIIKPASQ